MWVAMQRLNCQNCGTIPEEWMDGEGYPKDPPPYQAETIKCLGCEALALGREEVPEDAKGVSVYLTRPHV